MSLQRARGRRSSSAREVAKQALDTAGTYRCSYPMSGLWLAGDFSCVEEPRLRRLYRWTH